MISLDLRVVLDFFGNGPTLPGLPAPNNAAGSGEAQDSWSSGRPVDVFAKTEKWLTPAPLPDTSKWSSRESEIMGFSEYLSMLTSWAAQASLEFAQEIEQSSRWNGVFNTGMPYQVPPRIDLPDCWPYFEKPLWATLEQPC